MNLEQYGSMDTGDVKARRKAEEQYRNQKAQAEAQKADLLKKQRKIQECQEQIQRLDRYAERCLLEGQEKKARIYLERKVEWQERLAALIEEAGFAVKDSPMAENDQMPEEDSEKKAELEAESGTDEER